MHAMDYFVAQKLVEKRLGQYALIKKAVADCRADKNFNGKSGGKGKAYISDPTANTAISNVTPLACIVIEINKKSTKIKYPEKWLELGKAVFEHFANTNNININVKRLLYYKFIKHKNYNFICTKLGISKSKYYKELDKILWFGISYACQIGLMKVH